MPIKRKQWMLLAGLLVCLVLSLAYSAPVVMSVLFDMTQSPPYQPEIAPLPIVDEDPASALQPLSKVLDLDFLHGSNGRNSYEMFDDIVGSRLRHRQFQDLDKFAAEVRQTKTRLPGGSWRLQRVYVRLSEPAAGEDTSEADWESHMKLLQEWMSLNPESVTARIAYAETLANYAWRARSGEYASKVSAEQWELFAARLELAEKALNDAYALPTRCPHWYAAMQRVALGQSWDRATYDQLVDEAIKFEPLYLAYYTKKSYYLLPRWHGDEGESEKFMIESTDRVGGPEGSVLFYFTFTSMTDYYKQDKVFESRVKEHWLRIKAGFADTDRMHDVTTSMVNLYGQMAFVAGDRVETRSAMDRIGANWNKGVWRSLEKFELAKTWAAEPESNRGQKIGLASRP